MKFIYLIIFEGAIHLHCCRIELRSSMLNTSHILKKLDESKYLHKIYDKIIPEVKNSQSVVCFMIVLQSSTGPFKDIFCSNLRVYLMKFHSKLLLFEAIMQNKDCIIVKKGNFFWTYFRIQFCNFIFRLKRKILSREW